MFNSYCSDPQYTYKGGPDHVNLLGSARLPGTVTLVLPEMPVNTLPTLALSIELGIKLGAEEVRAGEAVVDGTPRRGDDPVKGRLEALFGEKPQRVTDVDDSATLLWLEVPPLVREGMAGLEPSLIGEQDRDAADIGVRRKT